MDGLIVCRGSFLLSIIIPKVNPKGGSFKFLPPVWRTNAVAWGGSISSQSSENSLELQCFRFQGNYITYSNRSCDPRDHFDHFSTLFKFIVMISGSLNPRISIRRSLKLVTSWASVALLKLPACLFMLPILYPPLPSLSLGSVDW